MIRKAVAGDIEKIAQIYRDAYSEEPYLDKWKLNFLIPELERELEKNEFRVAEVDKKIAGVVIYYTYDWYDGKAAYIQDIAVSRKFRRNGVAKSLMSTVESECRGLGVKRIVFDVHTGASKAISLYKKLGYAGNSMIQMEKELRDK